MSFRNYFIYCVCASPLSTSAHPKPRQYSWLHRSAEKPEKITRNGRANERERRNQREIIYKIDMFHHVPWILMCVLWMRPLRPTCKFSNAHYAHYFLHCDSSLFAAEDIFAIICSSRSFAVCRCLCFYSSQHRKLSICFSDQLAACMFLCRDQFNLQEKNRHNFSLFSHPLLGVSNS